MTGWVASVIELAGTPLVAPPVLVTVNAWMGHAAGVQAPVWC